MKLLDRSLPPAPLCRDTYRMMADMGAASSQQVEAQVMIFMHLHLSVQVMIFYSLTL